MTYARNHKGISLVITAIMLAVLLMFAALGIDIGYMYFEKNQLQVAADAAALAGAALITDTNDTTQTEARAEARAFAAKNRTAGAGATVQLLTDGSNSNPITSNDNDISVGNWDGTQYNRGGKPVNAVEVVPKRVGQLSEGRGHVTLFLGKIFKFFGADWSFMSAKARAVAAKPPRASGFISLGNNACIDPDLSLPPCTYPTICTISDPASGNPYRIIQTSPTSLDDNRKFAWTSLLFRPGACALFKDLMCNENPYQDVCNAPGIYGITGSCTDALRDFESLMYNPRYDRENKEIDGTGNVTGWWVMIPQVNDVADPMDPPCGTPSNPCAVKGHILIRIIAVCAVGGEGCRGYDICDTYPNPTPPPPTINNVIVIDRLSCISCADTGLGLKPVLVK